MTERVLEGTWEDLIGHHSADLAGHRVRLIILDSDATSETEKSTPDAATLAARVGRLHLGRTGASEHTGDEFKSILADKLRDSRL